MCKLINAFNLFLNYNFEMMIINSEVFSSGIFNGLTCLYSVYDPLCMQASNRLQIKHLLRILLLIYLSI